MFNDRLTSIQFVPSHRIVTMSVALAVVESTKLPPAFLKLL